MELLNEIWHLLRPPTPGCTPKMKLLLTPGGPRSQPALIAAAGRGRPCRGLRQSQCMSMQRRLDLNSQCPIKQSYDHLWNRNIQVLSK